MKHFQVLKMGARRVLVEIDTSRWDGLWGFYRFRRALP